MNLEEGPQSECTIFGSFHLVLRVSRMLGIAPLKFDRVPGGWRIQVSRIYRWYGLAVTIMFTLLAVQSLAGNLSSSLLTSSFTKGYITRRVISLVDIFVMSLVIVTAAWTGINRMRFMIDSAVQLQQINQDLQRSHQEARLSDRKKLWIAVFILIYGSSTTLWCYSLFMVQVINWKGLVFLSSLDIFYGISNMTIFVLIMQLALMVMWLVQTLQLLNTSLHIVLQELYKQKLASLSTPLYPQSILIRRNMQTQLFNTFTRKSVDDVIDPMAMNGNKCLETAPATLHRLAVHYCSVCDVIRQLNESSGLVILLLFISIVSKLIIAPYRIVVDLLQNSEIDTHNMGAQIAWTFFYLFKLFMMTEPCHRAHEQMTMTKDLINLMLRYTSLDNFTIISKLKLFSRHIVLNEVKISLKEFFTVNRTLLATVLTSTTTYLVIVIQFL